MAYDNDCVFDLSSTIWIANKADSYLDYCNVAFRVVAMFSCISLSVDDRFCITSNNCISFEYPQSRYL
jgi:hypothetical protein